MFEKEGIKYAIEETVGTECLSIPIEDFHFIDLAESQQEKAQCYKEGAEFGYNKAKEEMQAQIEKMKCCGNCEYQGADCEWFTNHKQPCTNLNKYQLRR